MQVDCSDRASLERGIDTLGFARPASALADDDLIRIQVLRQTFRWANGVVLIPTFLTLLRRGAYNGEVASFRPMSDLIDGPADAVQVRRVGGTMWGALRLLALQGWLTLDGEDAATRFAPTPVGKAAARWATAVPEVVERLPALIAVLADPAALAHGAASPAQFDVVTAAIAAALAGWHLPVPSAADDAVDRRALLELTEALDGLLVGGLLVALDIGRYVRDGRAIRRIGPSLFEQWISQGNDTASTSRLTEVALPLLAAYGLATVNPPALTPWGERLRAIAAPFAGLGVSYLRSYAALDTIIASDPDPLGINADRHVDRIVNVYASAGAGSGPMARTLLERVIAPIFSRPLAEQPAGIGDMGCGDGNALLRMARFIRDETPRGQALESFPLAVIGADYNEAALAVARATLAPLQDETGFIVRMVQADISDPDSYAHALEVDPIVMPASASQPGNVALGDLMHSFMFLLHNRRLVVGDVEHADTVFREAGVPDRIAAAADLTPITFGGPDGLTDGVSAAADLIAMLRRWRPYARFGLVALEGHSPSVPAGDAAGVDPGELPHVLNWGMHFLSQQYMIAHRDFLHLVSLSGYAPVETFGHLYPPELNGPDVQPATRFFSIAHYLPA